jgi:hypothetical protein
LHFNLLGVEAPALLSGKRRMLPPRFTIGTLLMAHGRILTGRPWRQKRKGKKPAFAVCESWSLPDPLVDA